MISFMTDTLMVIRAPLVAERGDQIRDWDNATETTLTGCRVQPMAGEEITQPTGRNAVVRVWQVYAPTGSDVLETDRIRYSGLEYEVDGFVKDWPSPTGSLASTQFQIRRAEG